MDRLLKIPEVAQMLTISRAKVYQFVMRGELPSVLIDGSRRVSEGDLVRFVDRLRDQTRIETERRRAAATMQTEGSSEAGAGIVPLHRAS